jgi:hypothetical protein
VAEQCRPPPNSRQAGNSVKLDQARPYERGCVLNFLEFGGNGDGWIPILSGRDGFPKPEHIYEENMRKPVPGSTCRLPYRV